MMQGDAYGQEIEILKADGSPVTDSEVLDVEIVIGPFCKSYAKNEISYSDGKWIFPLSQEETFRLMPTGVRGQVRVKWTNGNVEGARLDETALSSSMSREVL